jgi:hypothetical protein
MPTQPVPAGNGHIAIPLANVKGKALHNIHVYQYEEALNLDLQFADGLSLELIFRVGFQASANLLEYKQGNSRILKRLKPIRRSA